MDLPDTSQVRRRLVGAGLIGLAGSLLPRLASRASAGTSDATTTTAPPQRPTVDDVPLLQFAQTIELAAVALYDVALRTGGLGDDLLATVTATRADHLAYAQALSGQLGTSAPGSPAADVVEAARESFATGDDVQTATAAHQLEDVAVATHSELIGQLLGTDGAALIASILIVEARHSLVFGALAGISELDDLLLTNGDPLSPEKG